VVSCDTEISAEAEEETAPEDSPECNADDAVDLNTEILAHGWVSWDETFAWVENDARKYSPNSVGIVNWSCLERVINVHSQHELWEKGVNNASNCSNADSSPWLYNITSSRDSHQASEETVRQWTCIKSLRLSEGLVVLTFLLEASANPETDGLLNKVDGSTCRTSTEDSVGNNFGRKKSWVIEAISTATVEEEPSEPKNEESNCEEHWAVLFQVQVRLIELSDWIFLDSSHISFGEATFLEKLLDFIKLFEVLDFFKRFSVELFKFGSASLREEEGKLNVAKTIVASTAN
jgi:hypothetical protein